MVRWSLKNKDLLPCKCQSLIPFGQAKKMPQTVFFCGKLPLSSLKTRLIHHPGKILFDANPQFASFLDLA